MKKWRLLPSFKTVECEVVEFSQYFGNVFATLKKGQIVNASELFDTKAEAIQSGYDRLDAQKARHDKERATILKRQANLDAVSKGNTDD